MSGYPFSGFHEFGELALQCHVVSHVELLNGSAWQTGKDCDQVQLTFGLVGRDFLCREHIGHDGAPDGERDNLFATVFEGGIQFKFDRLNFHRRPFSIFGGHKHNVKLLITALSKCHQHSSSAILTRKRIRIFPIASRFRIKGTRAGCTTEMLNAQSGRPGAGEGARPPTFAVKLLKIELVIIRQEP